MTYSIGILHLYLLLNYSILDENLILSYCNTYQLILYPWHAYGIILYGGQVAVVIASITLYVNIHAMKERDKGMIPITTTFFLH